MVGGAAAVLEVEEEGGAAAVLEVEEEESLEYLEVALVELGEVILPMTRK